MKLTENIYLVGGGEVEYVMTNSSSVKYIDLDIAAEFIAGKRSRMSLAPMVITAGNMMAYEALFTILGKRGGADDRGYFWNPEKGKICLLYTSPSPRD